MQTSFEINNVNGVRGLLVNLDGPGVVVARAPNGSGKSSAIAALKAACGDKTAKAEPSDGVPKGEVRCSDGVVFRVGNRNTREGQPPVWLVSAGAIGRLIDPRIKDEKLAANERLRAMTELFPMPADDVAREELTQNDGELQRWIAAETAIDAMDLAKAVGKHANELANELEKQAHQAEGEEAAFVKQIGELGTLDFEAGEYATAKAAADEALRKSAVMTQTATARQQLERQQAEIRESLGPRPDSSEAVKEIEAISSEIADLDSKILVLKTKLHNARVKRAALDGQAVEWDSRSEILKRPLTGPTMAEAEAARVEAEALAAKATRAERLGRAREYNTSMKLAKELHRKCTDRAEVLRGIAKGTVGALGRLLERRGLPGLAVVDGRLCVRNEKAEGGLEDFERVSFGTKVRLTIGIALAGIDRASVEHRSNGNRLPLLALEPEFWLSLDDRRKAEVNAIAIERGVCLVTEEPAEGELRFERVG